MAKHMMSKQWWQSLMLVYRLKAIYLWQLNPYLILLVSGVCKIIKIVCARLDNKKRHRQAERVGRRLLFARRFDLFFYHKINKKEKKSTQQQLIRSADN
jgi:hypothetical protein